MLLMLGDLSCVIAWRDAIGAGSVSRLDEHEGEAENDTESGADQGCENMPDWFKREIGWKRVVYAAAPWREYVL